MRGAVNESGTDARDNLQLALYFFLRNRLFSLPTDWLRIRCASGLGVVGPADFMRVPDPGGSPGKW